VEHEESAQPVPGTSAPATEDVAAGPTGDQVVDEVLEVLDDLDGRPLREHVAAFESVHAGLQDRLADGQR